MISKATVHSVTVLTNRSTKAARGPAAAGVGSLCANVAGMFLHHVEVRHGTQEGSAASHANATGSTSAGERMERSAVRSEPARTLLPRACTTRFSVLIWSSCFSPAMDCLRDE